MPDLILTEEQARLVTETLGTLRVRDHQGNVLGTLAPTWTEEDIADARRRLASAEPRYTTAQVLEYLRSLEKP
jgi:hypothetical protein